MKKNLMQILLLALMLFPINCLAAGGKISYQDGTPVVDAVVILTDAELKELIQISCDFQGRFEFGSIESPEVNIRINIPNGEPFISSGLPLSRFDGNGLAIVLQPR